MKERIQERARKHAWLAIVIADVGLFVWGALAALVPAHLPGPSSASIVQDGYEGFTGGSWSTLVDQSAATADFVVLLFRMFGMYCASFSMLAIMIAATAFRRGERWAWWTLLVGNTVAFISPIIYDQIVHAVGLFELGEYVGIAVVYAALAVSRPVASRDARRGAAPPRGSSRRAWSSGDACAS